MQLTQHPAGSLVGGELRQDLVQITEPRGLLRGVGRTTPVLTGADGSAARPVIQVVGIHRVHRPTRSGPEQAQASAGHDLVDPAPERHRLGQAWEFTPDLHHRVLQGVLGLTPISQEPVRQPEQRTLIVPRQLLERHEVAILRPTHHRGLGQAPHRASHRAVSGLAHPHLLHHDMVSPPATDPSLPAAP